MKLSVKDLISIKDLTRKDIELIFHVADQLKQSSSEYLKNKSLAMIFEKPSTRTRVSFEVAMTQLGGKAIDLTKNKLQASRGESIKDTAKVLSHYVDAIMARLYSHQQLIDMAKYSSVPVINGLTDLLHPCQALSDLYTIRNTFGSLDNVKLAYAGDGSSNVCHSLMYACYKLGVKMSVAAPRFYKPKKQIIKDTHNQIEVTSSMKKALAGANIIYTDTWVSMGQESEARKRLSIFKKYQINKYAMKMALSKTGMKKNKTYFMHCLPAHRNYEVTDDVIDSRQSIVYEQAENRLHVQKAILYLLIKR